MVDIPEYVSWKESYEKCFGESIEETTKNLNIVVDDDLETFCKVIDNQVIILEDTINEIKQTIETLRNLQDTTLNLMASPYSPRHAKKEEK